MSATPTAEVGGALQAWSAASRWLVTAGSLFLAATIAGQAEEAAEPAPLRIGFALHALSGVNESDARAALKLWAQLLGKDYGVPVASAVAFFPDAESIKEAFEARRVDALTMSTVDYWKLRRTSPFFPEIVVGMVNGKFSEEYVVLVHREHPATKLADLRGRKLGVDGARASSLAAVWLETVLLEQSLGTLEGFWGEIDHVSKTSRVVLPVFFKQVDACIVTRARFATMTELNPQLGRQLRVIAESPPLISSAFFFRGDLASPYHRQLLAQVDRITQSAAGRQTLTLFQTDRLAPSALSNLDASCALLDRHKELLAAAAASANNMPVATSSAGLPQP